MNTSFAEKLINRRTEDGKWLQGCDHTTLLLNHNIRNKVIDDCVIYLKEHKLDFDTIACCGTSGLLVVPQISQTLKKNILVVRKADEKRYSPFQYEGPIPNKYIIIDDLICSGRTIKHILNTIKEDCPRSICLGVYSFFKDKCAYRTDNTLCKRDLGIEYL